MAKRYDGGRLPMLSIDEAKTAAANVGIPVRVPAHVDHTRRPIIDSGSMPINDR